MKLEGKILKLGDDINTDLIMPGAYLAETDPQVMADHVLEGLGDHLPALVKTRDVVVAGWNFGCGSSREQAAYGFKYAGIRLVVACSFARTFFRNAINGGLPVVECPAAVPAVRDAGWLAADLTSGHLTTGEQRFSFHPLPRFLLAILKRGGLLDSLEHPARKA